MCLLGGMVYFSHWIDILRLNTILGRYVIRIWLTILYLQLKSVISLSRKGEYIQQ